jgi:hypothetical protein
MRDSHPFDSRTVPLNHATDSIINLSATVVESGSAGFGGELTASNIQAATYTKFDIENNYQQSANGFAAMGYGVRAEAAESQALDLASRLAPSPAKSRCSRASRDGVGLKGISNRAVGLGLNKREGVPNRHKFRQSIVGDVDAELLLARHHHLEKGNAVSPQILD